MARMGPTMERSQSRSSRSTISQPHGRDVELKERRRREWMQQQERERKHERLKKRKIEEWEMKRKAEQEAINDKGRSSHRSCSQNSDRLPSNSKKVDIPHGVTKPTVMSQKFESSGNNTRLFKGREGTKIDVSELRRIKVDIHRNITATEISNELQREIVDPEDVKLKRRDGEGAKPIFEREELMKSVATTEVEEHRTVVVLNDDRTERKSHSARKRSASPIPNSRKKYDDPRSISDAWSSRRENSKYTFDRSESRRSPKHVSESGRSRDRSKEHRGSYKRADSRDHRSPRRTVRHDVSRDHRDRHNRSSSRNRESRRTENRHRSNRERLPDRESRDRDVSRETRIRNNRSRERTTPMSHHYAETVPFPLYYESFHPRPMMVGPMMPLSSQMAMGRGRMPAMMGPMRPIFPPRFMPPDMFRPAMNPNQRFNRMF